MATVVDQGLLEFGHAADLDWTGLFGGVVSLLVEPEDGV